MKRKTIIWVLIVGLALTFVLGVFLLKGILGKTYDFELVSIDWNDSFIFEDACRTEPERNMSAQAYKAELVDADSFFETFVQNNESFLYAVDENNQQSREETGDYLFFKNNRYYYCSVRGEKLYGTELVITFPMDYPEYAHTSLPINWMDSHINGCYGTLNLEEIEYFTWKEIPGINSFSDLIAYYERIQNIRVEIDNDNQELVVQMFQLGSENETEIPNVIRIKVKDEKIYLTYER